jgi:hypothetical protein
MVLRSNGNDVKKSQLVCLNDGVGVYMVSNCSLSPRIVETERKRKKGEKQEKKSKTQNRNAEENKCDRPGTRKSPSVWRA